MAFEEKIYDSDNHFDYALRERDQKKIYITEVLPEENGKKGYRCLGANCGNQLIAISIRKNPNHQPYFKHAPINIKKGDKGCVFSNVEYREALASSILTRLKRIKVPPIYKVNPQNSNEYKLIEESKYIEAHSVQSQVTFYEDEEGNVRCGKNPDVKKRYIIRRPDVVFFNEKGKPILFIELVITHKLDDDKIADLYRIGIDTIQIKVPKTSEDDIEKNFHSIKNTKWVYNEKEATTNYVYIPRENSQRILAPEELENRLFKESYRCRVFRIKDIIRAIGKSLESESYRIVEDYYDAEISRIERNTASAKQRLVELEQQYRAEAVERNRGLEKRIRTEEKELRNNIERAEQRLGDMEESNRKAVFERHQGEEDKIGKEYSDLEKRYFGKDSELEQGLRDYYRAEIIGIPIKRIIEGEERIVNEFREEEGRLLERTERKRKQAEEEISKEFRSKIEFEDSEIERLDREQRNLDETVRIEIDTKIESTDRNIRNVGKQQETIKETIWGEFRRKVEFEDSEIIRLEGEERKFKETISEEFYRELNESPTKLSRGIKAIMDAERLGSTFSQAKCEEDRYKRAREFFSKRTWEKG